MKVMSPYKLKNPQTGTETRHLRVQVQDAREVLQIKNPKTGTET